MGRSISTRLGTRRHNPRAPMFLFSRVTPLRWAVLRDLTAQCCERNPMLLVS